MGPSDSVSRRARSRWGRLKLLGALLEALLQCLEDQECPEDQGCQEADTATQDVSASTFPATWGLGQDMDQDLDMDQDQGLEGLDLVPHHFLPLVAMEQAGLQQQPLLHRQQFQQQPLLQQPPQLGAPAMAPTPAETAPTAQCSTLR